MERDTSTPPFRQGKGPVYGEKMIKWLKNRREIQKRHAEATRVIPITERIEQRRLKLVEENKPLDAEAVDDVIENLWIGLCDGR